MDLVEVEITGMAITARYGTLASGTVLRTDAAYAKHLVEECGAAKYTAAKATKAATVSPQTRPPSKPRGKASESADSPPASEP